MTIPLGVWLSPGATQRGLTYQRRVKAALDAVMPVMAQAVERQMRPDPDPMERFRQVEQALQPAARARSRPMPTMPSPGAPQFEPSGRVLPEEAAPYLRQMGPRWRQWEQGIFPVPGEPSFEPRAALPSAETTPLERTIQRRWEGGVGEEVAAREITPPGLPFALGRPLEYVAERFLDPAAAAGLQLAESPAGAGLPGVPELKAVTRGAEQLGIPESYMPTPRTRTFGEAYAGGPVNVFAAAWGSEEEQEKAQAVLEEAGLPRAMAARVVFDLTWVLPGAGVTKIDDVVRLVRLGGKAGGAARARVLSNPTLRRFVEAVKSEAGGPRVPGGRSIKVYRGYGRERPGSVYTPPEAGGGGQRMFEDADFYALDAKTARMFGPELETTEVVLAKPLLLRTDAEYRAISRAAGMKYPNPFGLPAEEQLRELQKLENYVRAQGHDGIIVRMSQVGDEAKTMGNLFGTDQVIRFRPRVGAEAALAGGPTVPGGRLRPTAPEGMRLINDIPATTEIRQRLAEIDAALAKKTVKGGRGAKLTERARLQAQADIDEILASGRPVEDQLDMLSRELTELQAEAQLRSVAFRGRWKMGKKFVPSEKEMRMGPPTAEELGARPSVARRREAGAAVSEQRYPGLSSAEVDARERVFREFVENAKFEPVEEPLVDVARQVASGGDAQATNFARRLLIAAKSKDPKAGAAIIRARQTTKLSEPVEHANKMIEAAQREGLTPQEIRQAASVPPAEAAPIGAPPEPLVGRARFTPEGEVVAEPTYATEAELAGYRGEQARLPMGAGERPIETAGPMFERPRPGEPPPVRPAEGVPPPREPPARPTAQMPPEPEPPRIPTVREVEAGSKPLPPQVRAQLMGEIENPRVPLMGWDEFAELWGPRFQENWITKAQDFLGGVVRPLRRSPEAVAVRNAMVMSDLYTGVQKTRTRALLFDWIGRHSNTLGLSRAKYARNVAVREGADIPKGLEQRLMHIAEHPEKYVPTPEQRAALDELQAIGDHVLQQELRHGIDIEPIVGEYVHRIVTKVPEGMPKPRPGLPGGGLRFPRVRPPYARGRSEVGLEQLWRAGYRYADDLESVAARWDTAVDVIANRKTLDTIKDLGIKPSARVPEELREAATVAREQFKGARAAVKKSPTTANKAALAEAETNLVITRRSLRLAAKSAAEGQPKVFGRITSPEAAEELGRYLDVAGPAAVEEAFRLARANMIMGDLSAMGIQGWTTFWRDTPTWINATGRSLQAWAENPYAFVVRNIDAIERGTRYGAIFPPSEFLLRMGGGLTRRFGRLPFVKQSQRSFEWWMFTAQTLRWRAVEAVAKTPDELLELAAVLRKQTGVSLMPGLTKAQRRVSQVFFAPKFTAAILGVLKDAARGGPAGWEARRTVATAFGGAIATVVAGNIAQGRTPNLSDPDEPGFFGIRVEKGWLYPLGPFQPVVVALYRNGRIAQDLAQGDTPRPRDLQAWPRFVESKLNVYEQALLRMAEATGLPLEAVRGQPFRGPAFGERGAPIQEATRFGPIGIVQAVEGIRRGAPVTGAEVAGIRTTVQTPYQQVRETWERERGKRNIPDVPFDEAAERWQIAEQDPVLAPLVQKMYGRSEEFGTPGAERAGTAEGVRLRLEESTGLVAEAQRIADGQLGAEADFARAFDEYSAQTVGMNKTIYLDVARKASSKEQEKLQAYYDFLETGRTGDEFRDPETGEFDHNAFYAEADSLYEALSPQVRKAIENDIKSANPLVRQYEPGYREARQIRSQAYDMSRHQGVSVEEEREARRFRSLVDQARDRIAGGGLEPGDVTIQQYLAVAEDNGVAPKMAYLAFALRPNSKGEISLRDPRYSEFLIDNASVLASYFPQFYPRRMLPALDPEVRESVIAGR